MEIKYNFFIAKKENRCCYLGKKGKLDLKRKNSIST